MNSSGILRRLQSPLRSAQTLCLLFLVAACVAPPTARPPVTPSTVGSAALRPVSFESIPGWGNDDFGAALDAFRRGCAKLGDQATWSEACAAAAGLRHPERNAARRFFESRFTPHALVNPDGTSEGLITGYYEPVLKGSRVPSPRYRHPVYGVPDDLLVVELGEVYPELRSLRLRGRLEGRRVVPYYTRSEIENGRAPVKGREVLWVDDPLDLFFLQVQGSGRVQIEGGETVRVGYADQNGHPYKSVGQVLVERGELSIEQVSMQSIREWAGRNPSKLAELLNYNASYVFFRELPAGAPGPIGSMGVPLTAGRSLAVDPRVVPRGAPVFLAATWPGTGRPLERLMVAQDTGGAIKGAVRADVFWGAGPEAARLAGIMRERGRLWVLLPKGVEPR